MAQNVGSIEYIARIDTAKLKADAAVASRTVGKVGDSSEAAAAQGNVAFGKFAKVGLAATAAAAAGLVAVFASKLPAAISRIDTLANAPKVLQNLGFSADESSAAIKKMEMGLRGLPTALDTGVNALMRFVTTTNKGINYAADLTLAFNNMALAGGRGPDEASRAIQQFTQILGRGKVEMEDWNTLNEVMPAQMKQVAASMLGPTASTMDLYNALKEGNITIEQFTDKIVDLNEKGGANFASFKDQAKTATGGIATAFRLMDTAITRGTVAIMESIGTENISDFANKIGDNFEKMGTSIGNAITYARPFIESIGKVWGNNLKTIGDNLSKFIKWWKDELWPSIQPFIIALGTQLAPIMRVIGAEFQKLINEAKTFVTENQTLIQHIKIFAQVLGAVLLGAIYVVIFAVLGLIEVFRFLVAAYNAVYNAIGTLVQSFQALWTTAFKTRDNVKEAFFEMAWRVINVFNSILASARNIWNAIVGAIIGAANTIINFYSSSWSWLIGAGRNIISGLINGIASMGGALWGAISGAAANIGNFFRGAVSWLFDSGKAIIEGLVNGISSMAGNVKGAVENVLKQARDLLPFSPAKEGPFSGKGWTLYSGMSIMDGLATGIQKNSSIPATALEDALSGVAISTKANISSFDDTSKNINGTAPVNINLNMSGVMSRSAADERDIARNLIKRLNQELTAKGQQAIGGIV